MKKILVVFTGGTIGSAIVDGTINTAGGAPFKLLEIFKQQYGDPAAIQFGTLEPIRILSENLAPPAWKIIIQAIEEAGFDQYDGVIVTHGTDTLAYSAAALSFHFHKLNKPLLLVASDYPLDNPKGNGLANFICAVEFIRQGIAAGVFVPYRNAGQATQIHKGTRLACSFQLSGDFFSVQNNSFARFDGERFVLDESVETGRIKPTENVIRLKPDFSSRILLIRPYPGLDYNHFQPDNADAVLHDLYHSGTACATGQWGDNHSLLAFLNRCRSHGVPVYLAPAIKSENAYQSTRDLIEHGAKMIWNTAIEAAYVKLMLAYGNFSDPAIIEDFLETDIAGEHIYPCR